MNDSLFVAILQMVDHTGQTRDMTVLRLKLSMVLWCCRNPHMAAVSRMAEAKKLMLFCTVGKFYNKTAILFSGSCEADGTEVYAFPIPR